MRKSNGRVRRSHSRDKYAASANDVRLASALLSAGIDIEVDCGDQTALEVAARMHSPDVLRLLDQAQKDLNEDRRWAAKPLQTVTDEEVYLRICNACHHSGIAGAPRVGDVEAWAAIRAKGIDKAIDHAINGYKGKLGFMPPKGGRDDLPNNSVGEAVWFMINQTFGSGKLKPPGCTALAQHDKKC
jgi:cytochrome c5